MLARVSVCLTLLLALGACTADSGGNPPPSPDAGASAGADAGSDAPLSFLDSCDPSNDACDSDANLVCFSFNNKGPHCTHECTVNTDCEAPSPGCNGMGVCKVP